MIGAEVLVQHLEWAYMVLIDKWDPEWNKSRWAKKIPKLDVPMLERDKGGRPRKSFAESISSLVRATAKPGEDFKEGRKHITWGHWSTLGTLKLLSLKEERATHPMGVSTDGMSLGGKDEHQCRLRDDWWTNGNFATITLPLIECRKYSPQELLRYINAHENTQTDKNLQQKQAASLDKAAFLRRVSYIICFQNLGISRPICLTIDKGSAERGYALWRMHRGDPVFVIFDSCHEDANACIAVGKKKLPPLFEKLYCVRSCHGGAHSIKKGHYFHAFIHELTEEQRLACIGLLRDDLAAELKIDIDDPDFIDKVKARMSMILNKISSFADCVRFMKEEYAAFFAKYGWSCLLLAVRAQIYKEDPAWLKPSLRVDITRVENVQETLFKMTYNQEDLKHDEADNVLKQLLFTDMGMAADGLSFEDEDHVRARFNIEDALEKNRGKKLELREDMLKPDETFLLGPAHQQKKEKDAKQEVMEQQINIQAQRLNKGSRVLMYTTGMGDDLTYKEFKDAAEHAHSKAEQNAMSWMLPESAHCLGTEVKKDYREPMRLCPWGNNIGAHSPDRKVLPSGEFEVTLPSMTSLERTLEVGPTVFEMQLAERMLMVTESKAPQAKKVAKCLLNVQNWHLCQNFDKLISAGDMNGRKEMLRKWTKIRIPNTKDVETQGGKLSKAAMRSHNKGAMKGEFPWAVSEHLVPTWVPWLKARDPTGNHVSKVGCPDSFSALDGRQPLSDFDVKTVKELEDHLFGHDKSFERNTIGLVLPTELALAAQQLELGFEPDGDALDKVKERLGGRNLPADKLVREELRQLLSLNYRGETGLNPADIKEFNGFTFPISLWPKLFLTEMVVFENYKELCDESEDAKMRLQQGRMHCLYLKGILKQKREKNEPCILELVGAYNKTRIVQLFDVCLQSQTLTTADLPEDEPKPPGFPFFGAPDRDLGEQKFESPATSPAAEPYDVYNPHHVQLGQALGKWHGTFLKSKANAFSFDAKHSNMSGFPTSFANPTPERTMQLGWIKVEIPPPETIKYMIGGCAISSWAFPLPTSACMTNSKLKAPHIVSERITRVQSEKWVDIRVVHGCSYAGSGLLKNRPRICVPKGGCVERPLACAIRHGFATIPEFSAGTGSAVRPDVAQTIKCLLIEEPARIKHIFNENWEAFMPKEVKAMTEGWLEIRRTASKEMFPDRSFRKWNAVDSMPGNDFKEKLEWTLKPMQEKFGDVFSFEEGLKNPTVDGLLSEEEELTLSIWHRVKKLDAKESTNILFALLYGQKAGGVLLSKLGFYDEVTKDKVAAPCVMIHLACQRMEQLLREEMKKILDKPATKKKLRAKHKYNKDEPAKPKAPTAKEVRLNHKELKDALGPGFDPFKFMSFLRKDAEKKDEEAVDDNASSGPDSPGGEMRIGSKEVADFDTPELLEKIELAKKEFLGTRKGVEMYKKAQQGFHCELDFCRLHVISVEEGCDEVFCSSCDEKIGETRKDKALKEEQSCDNFHNCARKMAVRKLRTQDGTACTCPAELKKWESIKIAKKHTFTAKIDEELEQASQKNDTAAPMEVDGE
eukprot:g20197.t1